MRSKGVSLQPADYRRCLIAYIDVLGMRQMLNASSDSASMRTYIKMLLSALIRETRVRRKPGSRMLVRTFSDLVLRFAPLSQETNVVDEELDNLCEIQNRLFNQQVLVRGGITVGDLFWNPRLLFGPGLVRAYELEHKLALQPRIIVDPVVLNMTDKDCYVTRDADGNWFIDYLSRGVVFYMGEDEDRFYAKARKFIEDGLRNSVELDSTRIKYLWLANYFNEIIGNQNPKVLNRRLKRLRINPE